MELPISVRVKERFGVATVIPKETASDVPPPGAGFETVIRTDRAVARSDAKIAAVNLAGLTNVVTRALPFQFTMEPWTNPAPFTVSVNPRAPGRATLGTTGLLMNGTGLVCAARRVQNTAKRTVKIIVFPKARMNASRSVASQPSVDIGDDQGKSGRTQPEGMRTSACNDQCPNCSQAASVLPARRGLPHARNYNSLYGELTICQTHRTKGDK